MNTTGSHPAQPARNTLESDPAYDYAEDAPIVGSETEDEDLLEEAERIVPLDKDDFLGEDQPVVPLDGEEFRKPEEED